MRTLVMLSAILCLCALSGCLTSSLVAPAASVAFDLAVKWKEGEATKYYCYDTNSVHRAVRMALQDLDFKVKSDTAGVDPKPGDPAPRWFQRKKATQGYWILAGNKDSFKIKIQPADKDVTQLKIRVDFWGNKPYAEAIYAKVDEYLSFITFDSNGNLLDEKFGSLVIGLGDSLVAVTSSDVTLLGKLLSSANMASCSVELYEQ